MLYRCLAPSRPPQALAWRAFQAAVSRALRSAAAPPTSPPSPLSRRPLPPRCALPVARPESGTAEPGRSPEQVLHVPDTCTGCGVTLQSDNPRKPGYFRVPKRLAEMAPVTEATEAVEHEPAAEVPEDVVGEVDLKAPAGEGDPAAPASTAEPLGAQAPSSPVSDVTDSSTDEFSRDLEAWALNPIPTQREEDQALRPKQRQSIRADSERVALDQLSFAEEAEDGQPVVLCARCYSLKHYGRVKDAAAERELPQFDLARRVGRKIALQRYRRAVVLCVVDSADFDGSLPRAALQALLEPFGGPARDGEAGGGSPLTGSQPQLVLALNKVDLLPAEATPSRVEDWVRRRARQAGLPPPAGVGLVSAVSGRGVAALLRDLHTLVGTAGDVWVVGAQNAGKSSLINAMRKAVGARTAERELTAAHVPGTTLGVLRVGGLMPPQCRMFDTPGVPHSHQLTSHLDSEEVKMVLPRKALKPRAFIIQEGQTLQVGACLRVDALTLPSRTITLTVWAAPEVACHLGNSARADQRHAEHAGTLLIPPVGSESVAALGELQPKELVLSGDTWHQSSRDLALAGLGWVAVALRGEAVLRVWAPLGLGLTTRDAFLPDIPAGKERPGFTSRELKSAAQLKASLAARRQPKRPGEGKLRKARAAAKRAGAAGST